jgi:DNA-binding CsgD family transcriptional regulator
MIEARLAQRARIMLMAADGASNRDIADIVGAALQPGGVVA